MAKSLAKSWQGGSGHGSGGRGGGGETGGGGGGGEGGGGRGEGGGGGGGSGGQLARRRRTALIKSNNPHLAGGEKGQLPNIEGRRKEGTEKRKQRKKNGHIKRFAICFRKGQLKIKFLF